MRKFVLAAIAASLVATPALAAPQRTIVKERPHKTVVVERGPGYREKTVVRRDMRQDNRRPTAYRNWQRGQRFEAKYAPNYRQIDYRRYNRLYAPPRGYQWVGSGNDAVLVSLASGLIGAVIGGALFN